MPEELKHIYIHIPFCDGKCIYCGFYSERYSSGKSAKYLDCLAREMDLYFSGKPAPEPETVYIGGGTPTVLDAAQLQKLLDTVTSRIGIRSLREWTMEVNPGTLSEEKARILAASPVNRLSIGAQTFNNKTLQRISRRHNAADIGTCVNTARAAGFKNIGLDLIAGLPEESDQDLHSSIQSAIDLAPDHISVYALGLEANSQLGRMHAAGNISVPDEEAQVRAIDYAAALLADAGYNRYEISNYAKPGRECLHNLACWRGMDYKGFGPAASSRSKLSRMTNTANLNSYIENLSSGMEPDQDSEILSPDDDITERLIFNFRLAEGVNLQDFATAPETDKEGKTLQRLKFWKNTLERLHGEGLVIQQNDRWLLTERGRLFADHVASELIDISQACAIVFPDMHMIDVILNGAGKKQVKSGTAVGSLLESDTDPTGLPYIGALVNNDASSLSYPLTVNCEVEFVTMANPYGWRIYRNSLCFILAKAANAMFPGANFSVQHSFGLGLYCSFDKNGGITKEELAKLEAHIRKLVEEDLLIERHKISYADAVNNFQIAGQTDKLNLLKFRNPPRVVIHSCGGFSDLAHGPLAPRTGVLGSFRLIHYKPGFVLHLPDKSDPHIISEFKDQPHLFHIFQEHKEWGRMQNVDTVGRLNEIIAGGMIEEFIAASEARHEKKTAQLAETIATRKEDIKMILIAGPSSSGKTTFAKRLSAHLMANGVRPVTISVDDYFVGPERNPVDENGVPDYEHVEAVDLELFNNDLLKLVNNEEIALPFFNFRTKKREYNGNKIDIKNNQILIVEGIHCLNPRLTMAVPPKNKFKIYISALTQLNLDRNNRISTTDNRLMRRLTRDHLFRGHSPLETLRLWPNVRKGEKTWIFPFQRQADATFNSALDYELAVLKPFVEPLLLQIKPDQREYAEARRLSEFLLNFLGTPEKTVPQTSILREYIGGSSLRY